MSGIALIERLDYAQRVVTVRAALTDDAAFDGAWREGRMLRLEQAIEFTLGKMPEIVFSPIPSSASFTETP